MSGDEQTHAPSAPRHALLAGGGTGGHVFPALAVAEVLVARGWTVSFVGGEAGMERRLVAERGLPFYPLPARPFLGRGLLAKTRAAATLAASGIAAARLVRRLGAHVVLGTGGYVSAPAVVGARLARRPVLLLEPNAKAGVANRFLSRFARGAAVGYREAGADLKCPAWVTGVPVRAAFFAVPEALPQSPHLLVLGGSQGARQINDSMIRVAARLLSAFPALSILHQAGEKNLEATRQAYAAAGWRGWRERVEVVPFLADVAAAMAASSLIVSRAGAITVAEICAAGRGSVLVPLAIAQAHQVDNARVLADAGAARMIPGNELTPERLGDLLGDLLADRSALAAMARAARSLARPDAAAMIADVADRLALRGREI
jgi:UDP-N-acetylglucosamine--N-acetylmuramyl-(pentapeptide) pyrophosphoryl-undecaprenol N-acetylglucosamine transferase